MSENYIGTDPSFGSFGTQTITGTGTTSYALDQTVGESGQILVHKRLTSGVDNIALEGVLNGNLRLEDGTASGSGTFGDNVVDEDGAADIPVYLAPETDYTITLSGGVTNITLSTSLPTSSTVDVVFLGRQSASPFLGFSSAQSPHLDTFSGDASTTTFTLTQVPAANDGRQFMVFVDNVYQRYGSSRAFTTSGTTLTFNSAPPSGIENIQVYQLSQQNVLNKIDSNTQLADGVISNNSIADGTIQANKLDVTPKLASGTGKSGNTVNLFSNVGVVAGGRKNLLINGDFRVRQRPDDVTGLTSQPQSVINDQYGPDRWFLRREATTTSNAASSAIITFPTEAGQRNGPNSGVISSLHGLGSSTISVSNSTPISSGVYNSLGFLNSIAATSTDTNDLYMIGQRIPSRMAKHLRYGSAALVGAEYGDKSGGEIQPQSVTLSFWVIAYDGIAAATGGNGVNSPTGTYTVNLVHNDDAGNIFYNGQTYTINSPGEWEYKTITFKGCDEGSGFKTYPTNRLSGEDLSGRQEDDLALELQFIMGSGTGYTSGTFTSDTWHSTRNQRISSSQVNLQTKTSAIVAFCNVQLETGDTATHFEQTPYEFERQLCCDFYQQSYEDGMGPSTTANANDKTRGAEVGVHLDTATSSVIHPVRFEYPTTYPPRLSGGQTDYNRGNPDNAVSIYNVNHSLVSASGQVSQISQTFSTTGSARTSETFPSHTSALDLARATGTNALEQSSVNLNRSYIMALSNRGFGGLLFQDNVSTSTRYAFHYILNNEIQRNTKS